MIALRCCQLRERIIDINMCTATFPVEQYYCWRALVRLSILFGPKLYFLLYYKASAFNWSVVWSVAHLLTPEPITIPHSYSEISYHAVWAWMQTAPPLSLSHTSRLFCRILKSMSVSVNCLLHAAQICSGFQWPSCPRLFQLNGSFLLLDWSLMF